MPRRHYTPALANRALPLVSRIVADVKVLADEIAALLERHPRARHEAEAAAALDGKLQPLRDRWQLLEKELVELGVELKDPRTGLIDFRAMRDGVEVYLCWKLGEPEVGHWHPLDTGFAGRQPIDTF